MLFLYPIVIFLYAIYSFALTDPNIVFFNNGLFLKFQQFMWGIGYGNRPLSSLMYTILILIIFAVYFYTVQQIKTKKLSEKNASKILIFSIIMLIFSNPALSHDIYNYIFNARMVVDYQANPHIKTAWDFTSDSWTRFVQNAHSPAPYGYGWTGLSIIPYLLGIKRLKTTILAFKLLMGLFFYALIYFQKKLANIFKIKNANLLIYTFALNPLVLIETFSNGHNDVVMMGLLLAAFYYFYTYFTQKKYYKLIVPVTLFIASISIKFASIVSLGGVAWWYLGGVVGLSLSFGFTNSIAHFSPLLTSRSQRFLPWYLIWSFSFFPLTKEKWLRKLLLAFSFSSLLSYVPSLYYPIFDLGEFESILKIQRQQIAFITPFVVLLLTIVFSKLRKPTTKDKK
ncbi:hypothetical protein ACFL1M_02735 [Patescibacteria group bacterium]